MGQQKLLLPWGDWTVLDELLHAWTSSRVDQVIVVIRRQDHELQAACRPWPVQLVQPEQDPQDMKQSVQLGLTFLQDFRRPQANDRCFIAPADLPGLSSAVIDRLLRESKGCDQLVVPQFDDRIGHPALFPWPLTQAIYDLPSDAGINRIVEQSQRHVVSFVAAEYFSDIDTPQDYQDAQRARSLTRPEDYA